MDEILNFQPVCKKTGRLIRSALDIKASTIHGCGVFADQIIYPGEVIEECPVVLLPHSSTIVFHAYDWDEHHACLALGYGSIYNHSKQPNAYHKVDQENRLVRIIANKLIYRGDEIFINYGENWLKERGIKDLTDPLLAKPIAQSPVASASSLGRTKGLRMLRFTILLLILLFIYLFPHTASKPHVRFSPVVTSVPQKLNLMHWGTPSTAPDR